MKIKEISIFDKLDLPSASPGRELGIKIFIPEENMVNNTPSQLKKAILISVEAELSRLLPDEE